MKKFLFAGVLMLAGAVAHAGVNVWTHHNDNNRTGANLSETQLTPANVNTATFGKLWDYEVDSSVYAQPLIIQNVNISGLGVHNVLLIASMNNTVYAFDADNNNGGNVAPLWETNFNDPAAGVMPVPAPDVEGGYTNIDQLTPVGIMSTPVVDTTAGTVYVVARTKENGAYVQRLHALDITTGAERANSPVTIRASVSGTGYDAVSGVVTFNNQREGQRAALGLVNGKVLIAWSALADQDPYHGWVMEYDGTTLQQLAVFNDTPNGSQGGFWQSGDGPAIDANGYVYYTAGNGSYDGVANFGETVLKLNLAGLTVKDWFTPDNNADLSLNDLDLGVSGPLLIPGTTAAINGSKTGRVYVMNTTSLGKLVTGNGQIPQNSMLALGHIHGAPVYYPYATPGQLVYMWSENDVLKAYKFNGTTLGTSPVTQSSFAAPPGMPGGFMSLSSNGSTAGTGVLWASIPYSADAEEAVVQGVLRAFDASDLSHELWDSQQVPARDGIGNFAKYVPPTVANGKVYIPTFSNKVRVYGLFASQAPSPTGSLTSSKSTSTAAVNLTTVGTSDWTHWPGYVHKSTGGSQISDFTPMYPPDPTTTYTDDARVFSWTDGTPTASGSVTNGAVVGGTGAGYQIAAPADATTTRTLTVYLGGWNSAGKLRAYLSDGSAEDIIDVNTTGSGSYYYNYTFTYKAAHAGQLLYVEWTQVSSNGNVTLAGAALMGGSASSTPPAKPTGVSASQGTSSSGVTVTWTASSGASSYSVYRSTVSGTQGSLIGTTGATSYTDSTVTAGSTYYYTIVASNAAGSSAPSTQVSGFASTTATSAPATPTGVSASKGASATNVTVTWTMVSGATSYTVYRSTASGTQGPSVGTSTTPTFTDGTVTAGTTYYYSVTATNSVGTSAVSAQVSGYASQSTAGALGGSGVSSTAAANLTTVGTSDWAHWPEFTEKTGGGAQISNAIVSGTASSGTYGDDQRTLSWTDGSPTTSGSSTTGEFNSGVGSGWQITVPADTTSRTLTLYVGGWSSAGTLTAHLSDVSAPDFVDTTFGGSGQYDATYSLTYHAAAAGQTLTIKWVQAAFNGQTNGNVTISGAALSGGSTVVTPPPATPTGVSATHGTSATSVTVAWTAVSGASSYTVYRSTASGTQGTSVGTSTTASYTDSTVVAGTTYYYSVTATNSGGTSAVSAQASGYATAAASGGALAGAGSSSIASANLTSIGAADWAHWPEFTEKSTGGAQISNVVSVGTGTGGTYGDDQRTLTWTDGSPTVSGSSTTGKYISGIGSGLQITAPADTTNRTLTVYVGGWSSSGTFTAHLSDGSAADYVSTAYSGSGQYDATYTLTYHAASAAQTLTVTWTHAAFNGVTNGNVTVSGAALSGGSATVTAPSTPTGVAATHGTSATSVTVSWNAVSGASSYTIYRSTAAGTQGSSIGTATATSYVDSTVTTGTTYYYSLTATNSAGTSGASAQASGYTSAAPTGSLTGSAASTIATANLTTVGTSDWAHWPEFTEKSTGAAQISNLLTVGAGSVGTYNDDQRTLTWSDGSPTLAGSMTTGKLVSGIGSGLQITAPADTSNRTLTVYVGGWMSSGTLTAHLSDGSAADYVDTSISGNGQYDGTYTLTYHAGSAGQTLTVTWSHAAFNSQTGGNVTMSGAALSGGSAPATAPAAPAGVTATRGTSASSVTVTWTAVSGAASYTIYRSTTSGTQGTALGTSTTTTYTDSTAVAGTTYYYSVCATNSAGTSTASTQASGYATAVAAGGGALTGTVASSTVTANLTTIGTSDWAHWPEFTEKSTGAAKISNVLTVGTGSVGTYNDDQRTLTWSDGSPTLSGSVTTGKYTSGIGSGLQITVPADTTSRTLTLYVGGWASTGTLTAHLSDGSATDYSNSSLSGNGQYDGVYTLAYHAASAGQTLTLTWKHAALGSQTQGNVTLSGAALH